MKVTAGTGMSLSRGYRYRKTVEAAKGVVVAPLHRPRDLDGGNFPGESRKHYLAFETGKQLPDTHVNAGPESDVAAGLAFDVVAVRILPAAWIAIGGAKEHQHLLAFADAKSRDINVPCRGAEESLHWTLEADRLLECVARQ